MILFFLLSSLTFASPMRSPEGQGEARAWFIRPSQSSPGLIRYCVKAKNKADKKEMEELVEWVVGHWHNYYLVNAVGSDVSPDPDGKRMPFRQDLDLSPRCKGDEDLTIYFGVEDDRVQAVKKLYDSPLGFAHLEEFNEDTAAAHGFLWIADAPELRWQEAHLEAIVTHEVGHIFGNGHVTGTIMDETIADTITRAYQNRQPFIPWKSDTTNLMASIDLQGNLMGSKEIDRSYVSHDVDVKEGSDLGKALKALTGETLLGKFEIGFRRFLLVPDEIDGVWNYSDIGSLYLCRKECDPEQKNARVFKAEYGKEILLPLGEEKIFRRVFRGKEYFVPREILFQPGAFIDPGSGRRIEFLVSSGGGKIVNLDLLVDGKKIRL